MIWFIVGLVVAIVIIVGIFRDSWYDWYDKIFGSIVVLLISFCLSLIVLFIASTITSCFAEIDYKLASDTKIIALKDNQNVNGSFYVMGGYVNENLYYYYVTETELGCKVEKIRACDVYIKYTDDRTHIEKYEGEFANDTMYLWGFPVCDYRYVIYCPEGTVTNEFKVDLE